MPAPARNRNAVKPPDKRRDKTIRVRCTHQEREAWNWAALQSGARNLSAWVVKVLNTDAKSRGKA